MPGAATLVFAQLESFGLPAPVYVVPVAVALVGIAGITYLIDPEVTDWTVAGLSPWVAFGAVAHVLYRQGALPGAVEPLFGAPMVVLTTGLVVVVVWSLSELIAGMRPPGASSDRQMGVFGSVVVLLAVGGAVYVNINAGDTLTPLWPLLGLFGAAVLSGLLWVLVSLVFTETATSTGKTGVAVLFAHILDGTSVLVAYDVLKRPGLITETTIPARIVGLGAQVPVLGGGGVFLLAKVVLAVLLLVGFKRFVDYTPTRARLALGLVGAVGLASGAHNTVLFVVSTAV